MNLLTTSRLIALRPHTPSRFALFEYGGGDAPTDPSPLALESLLSKLEGLLE